METVLPRPASRRCLELSWIQLWERGIKIDQALSRRNGPLAKPENGYYVDSLGWALYKSGLLAEALMEIIKKAVALVGDDPVIYEHLGEIYLKQQKVSDARDAWLSILLRSDPSNDKAAPALP